MVRFDFASIAENEWSESLTLNSVVNFTHLKINFSVAFAQHKRNETRASITFATQHL